MSFNYKKFVTYLFRLGKKREAGFIQKFYLEQKTRQRIINEMYMNSTSYYYSVKRKSKELIDKHKITDRFLVKD